MSLFSKQKNMNFILILIVIAAEEEAAGGDAGRLKEWSYFYMFSFLAAVFYHFSRRIYRNRREMCGRILLYNFFSYYFVFSNCCK